VLLLVLLLLLLLVLLLLLLLLLLLPQGVAGWVHEGLLAAAAYVVSNTVDALAEAAQRCPGWPLVVAGEAAACLPASDRHTIVLFTPRVFACMTCADNSQQLLSNHGMHPSCKSKLHQSAMQDC
jgi:hypothetical protein